MAKGLKVYRIEHGEIVHIAAYNDAEALGMHVAEIIKREGHWPAEILAEEPTVEELDDDANISIGTEPKIDFTVAQIKEYFPGPAWLCTSEY